MWISWSQNSRTKKHMDIGRLRHFVEKFRFIHGPGLQNRLETFNYDQKMSKIVGNELFFVFFRFFQPKYHKRWYRCGTAWRWRYHLPPEPCLHLISCNSSRVVATCLKTMAIEKSLARCVKTGTWTCVSENLDTTAFSCTWKVVGGECLPNYPTHS